VVTQNTDGATPAAGASTLARMCAAASLAYCSYAMCRLPLLPLFARHLGADVQTVGLIVGASTMTGVCVKLPAGALSDVWGRRALLLTGAFVFAIMPFTYLGAASITALIVLRACHGSATAIFGPVAAATLSDVAPAHARATWLSTYATAQGAGQAIGPVFAGYLLAAGRFDLAFATAGLIALLTPAIVVSLSLSPPAPASSSALARLSAGIRDVAREPLILLTSGAQASQFILHGTLSAFLPLFAYETLGLSAAQLGWLFGMQTVATLAARPLLGMLSDRIGRRGLIAAGLALCGTGVLMISIATSLETLLPAMLTYAIGVALTTASAGAFITDLARGRRYGAAHGVFGTIYDVGDALGPVGGGLLVSRLGYAVTFQIAAAFAMIAAAAFYVVARRLQLPTPNSPS
jgi:MFS transporter, DHA1 family, multidrug resistance protein